MRHKIIITGFLIAFLGLFAESSLAQQITSSNFIGNDSSTVIEILPGVQTMEFRKLDDSTELQILAGNVRLKQGSTFFYTDSCVINSRLNIFEAFGKVHINDADTSHIYADYLKYKIDKRYAYFNKRVRMTDGKGTLTTENLEYDVSTKIGIYKNGGKVVNQKTILTSKEGYYYADIKDIYFKKDVILNDPGFNLKTDSLLYNTQTETARFISETIIRDSSNRTIHTKDGFYNLKTKKAEFGRRPVIKDGGITISGNNIAMDDVTGISQVIGNGIIRDSVNNLTIIANEIFRNNKTESFLATKKPLMIIKQDNDSLFITADTLFSARLSDLKKSLKDSTSSISKNATDSSNRYFEAFRNVRVFSDSLQSISDSLFYSFKDSTFRLYKNPVVWANKNQITGDTIYLLTKNKKADKLEVLKNAFMINQVDKDQFNQVSSYRIDAYFNAGNIDSLRAKQSVESIYYVIDEDSTYIGVNESKAELMDIYFLKRELNRIVYRSEVSGKIWPIREKSSSELRLKNFNWLEIKRPKSRFELFE